MKETVISILIAGVLIGGAIIASRRSPIAESTEGNWSYSYKILKSVQEIPVDVAEEEIKYKGNLVFIHFHINSPVR